MDVLTIAETVTAEQATATPPCFGREIPKEREAIRLCAMCAIRLACLDAFDAPGSAARELPMMWPAPVLNGNGKH